MMEECDGVKAHIVSVSDELIGYIRKFSDGSILDLKICICQAGTSVQH